jgi:MFS family permease
MESSASAGHVASAVLDPRRWRALALLCGAFFMVLLDGTITIVALPSIGAGLRFSEQGLQWVLSAYALTFGGLLLGGRAADLLGRRRVFMAGAVFFTTASHELPEPDPAADAAAAGDVVIRSGTK